MSFFTRGEGAVNLVRGNECYQQHPTATQPATDRPIRILANHQSYHCHQKAKDQDKSARRRFRVARLAEAPNFAQQQTQIVRGTFQCVGFAHIGLSPQPTPPSTPGLTYMREGSLASFAAPPIQAPSLLSTHSSSIGPKGGLISGRFVGPAPNLLPPLRDISSHLPFCAPSQQPVVVIAFVHHQFRYRVATSRQHHVGLCQTPRAPPYTPNACARPSWRSDCPDRCGFATVHWRPSCLCGHDPTDADLPLTDSLSLRPVPTFAGIHSNRLRYLCARCSSSQRWLPESWRRCPPFCLATDPSVPAKPARR